MKRAHPAVLVGIMMIPAAVLLLTIDVWTPVLIGVPLAALIAVTNGRHAPVFSWRPVAVMVVVSAGGAFAINAVYGMPSGAAVWEWGYFHVTEGSLQVALAMSLRVCAIAVPAILVTRRLDFSAFAAWCAVSRVAPYRFVIALLIGIRLVPVIAADVSETISARRARGVGSPPLALAMTVLVVAIRRAIRMSDIAEIRGFARADRVWSRFVPLRAWDYGVMFLALVITAAAVAVSVAFGHWDVLRA